MSGLPGTTMERGFGAKTFIQRISGLLTIENWPGGCTQQKVRLIGTLLNGVGILYNICAESTGDQ